MRRSRGNRREPTWYKTAPIRTNLMEIVGELAKLTDDDNLVVAAVKSIMRSCNVRTTRSLAPVKVVPSASLGRGRIVSRRTCWV
jgi:hypothetical protein